MTESIAVQSISPLAVGPQVIYFVDGIWTPSLLSLTTTMSFPAYVPSPFPPPCHAVLNALNHKKQVLTLCIVANNEQSGNDMFSHGECIHSSAHQRFNLSILVYANRNLPLAALACGRMMRYPHHHHLCLHLHLCQKMVHACHPTLACQAPDGVVQILAWTQAISHQCLGGVASSHLGSERT